ncbi:MAG: DNA polymerase III, subunit gamma and tau [Lentisphaerae bacterium GWF2_44_16]|nr:MAG: DNA polymerase III, subunit gamma and tau [Lentisphaerae bacterium GWF2_44_16]
MNEYQVIARKWRPQKFSDVIGQEHITRTLKNEIMQKRTAHAYLFVGPRGIGKTTSARIFAKALNCTNPLDGEPCCKCSSCVSIADGSNIDVIEIDAASQNSVQSIRTLCDEVMFSPVKSKYKIYIIDEVHMLTAGAWNAFLKTVEEPPAHAKFIFATTEAHKVLPTIVSRCQRFDLRRIPPKLIVERLRQISTAENFKISDTALEAIARAADGGMRDAQSLLDQMISFFSASTSSGISDEHVLSLFGLTSSSDMEALVKATLTNDKAELISNIHNLALKGKNLETLFNELLSFLRGIQLCKLFSNPDVILEDGEESIARFKRLGQNIKPDVIQRLLENLSPVGRYLHDALNKQVFLETIILKAMRVSHAVQIEDLIERLNQIRRNENIQLPSPHVEEKTVALPVPEKLAEIPKPPPETTAAAVEAPKLEEAAAVEKEAPKMETAMPIPEQEVPKAEPEIIPAVETQNAITDDTDEEEYSSTEAEETKSPSLESSLPLLEETKKPEETSEIKKGHSKNITPKEKPSPENLWRSLIADADAHLKKPTLKEYMLEGAAISFENSVLTVSFDEEYEKEHFDAINAELPLLTVRLKNLSGDRDASIKIEVSEGAHETHHNNTEKLAEAKKRVEKNQFVQTVMDLFDGQIVDVHHG